MIDIESIDIIIVGIFSMNTKTVIIKLYLLNLLVTFINCLQDKIFLLYNIDNSEIINNNNLYINIYKSFLFLPFKKYFKFLSRKIFKRQKLKIKNIFYKNYYLIELSSDKIIFSLQSLYNIKNEVGGSKYQLKIHNKKQIWEDILYHCHILKNNYISKNSLNFNEEDYQDYYAILELKSTFPRRTFLIRFLPVLNGLALIHEYIQMKLSSLDGNEKNQYKECDSIYGYNSEIQSINEINSNSNKFIFLKNEPIILKKVNLFFVESFFVKIPSINLFIADKQKNIYFSQEIMDIIDNCVINERSLNNTVLKKIEKKLYEEYLKIIQTDNEFENNSSNNLLMKQNYENNEVIKNNDNDSYLDEESNSSSISLKISKNFILMSLFEKNIHKFDTIRKTSYSQKVCNIIKDGYNKIHSNSKKDFSRLNEILNDNISDYTGPLNLYNLVRNDNNYLENNSNKIDSNSFKISNIFESNIIFNGENSLIKDDLFSIDVSNIQTTKKPRKNSNILYNNRNNIEFPFNDKNSLTSSFELYNKSTKKRDSMNSKNGELYYNNLDSKEEFFEGEKKNKVK